MNSLLEKEGMAGQVQMVYIDPPYGIRYGSNFQPFVNRRDVKDGKDEDLTQEPEMVRAFRDTWELGIHSYLTYLRDRLLLARDLLHESGSVFVQIGDENVHLVRAVMDEVFGAKNFFAQINFRSKSPLGQKGLAQVYDYIVWYCQDRGKAKFRPIFREQFIESESEFSYLDDGTGNFRKLKPEEVGSLTREQRAKVFKRSDLREAMAEYSRMRNAIGSTSSASVTPPPSETPEPAPVVLTLLEQVVRDFRGDKANGIPPMASDVFRKTWINNRHRRPTYDAAVEQGLV
jgi:adenine-specific DNA-methyltransferase